MVGIRDLLVATDGSTAAEQAALFAGRMASRLNGSIRVVSVVPERSVVTTAWLGMAPEMPAAAFGVDAALEEATRLSEAAASVAKEAGCPEVVSTVEIGDPARTIVSVAESCDADAIVLGRRGTGGVGGLLLGSVSTKVSHLSDRTVITVRENDLEGVERVLVAVDGSEHSLRAVEVGADLASAYKAPLELLHVVSMTTLVPLGMSGADGFEYGRLEDSMQARAELYLAQAKEKAWQSGVEASTAIQLGDPATHVVSHAAKIGADTICVGRRGLGNVTGLLMGSVSHKIAHLADQTVITVR
jgi:nucleotide-binding universal stress UspA family protein